MDRSIEREFYQGLEALDDLHKLGSSDQYPLINRVVHHLNEVKRSVDEKQNAMGNFPRLNRFFQGFLLKNLKNLKEKTQISKVKCELDTSFVPVEKMDLLLEVFPLVCQAVGLFPFQGEMQVNFNENEVEFTGSTQVDEKFEQQRPEAYVLTRKLLSHGMVLTYRCHKVDKNGLFEISLKCTMSHNLNEVYGVDFSEQHGIVLGLSNIFPQFRTTNEYLKNVGKHICIEITKDLKVERTYRLTQRHLKENAQVEILHFAFLFRPVSIIIPKEGRLYPSHLFGLTRGTGRENFSSQQEVENKVAMYRYLDFFSLISC